MLRLYRKRRLHPYTMPVANVLYGKACGHAPSVLPVEPPNSTPAVLASAIFDQGMMRTTFKVNCCIIGTRRSQ